MTKIFGIGLSKTGTTSLYEALAILGYRTITNRHMRTQGLTRWFEGDFTHDYFAEIDAATDLPIATYFRELDRRYPNSKFILTVRDPESWASSLKKQLGIRETWRSMPEFNRRVRLATYGIYGFNRARMLDVEASHRRSVVSHFAGREDQLLILNLFSGEGWRELCAFLGCEVPTSEFPNVKPGHSTHAPESMQVSKEIDKQYISYWRRATNKIRNIIVG